MNDETKAKIAELREYVANMRSVVEKAENELDYIREWINDGFQELGVDERVSYLDLSLDCSGINEIDAMIGNLETDEDEAENDAAGEP